MANFSFTRMHLREIEQKRNLHEELQRSISETKEELQFKIDQIERLKQQYQAKLYEVDGKSNIQEQQLEERRSRVAHLRERNLD